MFPEVANSQLLNHSINALNITSFAITVPARKIQRQLDLPGLAVIRRPLRSRSYRENKDWTNDIRGASNRISSAYSYIFVPANVR